MSPLLGSPHEARTSMLPVPGTDTEDFLNATSAILSSLCLMMMASCSSVSCMGHDTMGRGASHSVALRQARVEAALNSDWVIPCSGSQKEICSSRVGDQKFSYSLRRDLSSTS